MLAKGRTLSEQGGGVAEAPVRGRSIVSLTETSENRKPGRPVLLLYLGTAFFNAAWLFLIEPMIARMILPLAGGSPAVWNTSVFFFQLWLLFGYLYAHVVASRLGAARRAVVHLALLATGILFLPVGVATDWFTAQSNPAVAVFAALVSSIGIPFLALSAGAPLLQKWFSETEHPAARDPYFIYAASNLGSLVGLLSYPFFFEPSFTLRQQAELWLYGYLALSCATAACALLSRAPVGRRRADERAARAAESPSRAEAVTPQRRLRWLCWSFVPSSLLLGTTSHITTDIASVPLLWVLPLVLYLLSYVVAFARERWAIHEFVVRRQAFLILAAALTVFVQATAPVAVILPLHLLAFFVTSLVCHGALAKDRPGPSRLTEFYFWISAGGVMGGLLNTFVAPLLFPGVLEYPLMMIAAAFLRPYVGNASRRSRERLLDGALPLGLFAGMAVLIRWSEAAQISELNKQLLAFGVPGVVCLSFAYRPIRFGLGLGAIFLGSVVAHQPIGKTLYQGRSFFGVYRVVDDPKANRRLLFHGTTLHGAQNLASPLEPVSYYHRTGPAGRVLQAVARIRPGARIALVGLGTGALACHGAAEQKLTFFEIDPLVEKIARDSRLFTYLGDCSPEAKVIIGDARLSLARMSAGSFDLLVLDAFSSDAIPTHLLTVQAVKLYLTKIATDGFILVHISSRYMDLAPIFDRLGRELDLAVYLRDDAELTPEEFREGKSPSHWVVLGRDRQALARVIDPSWRVLPGQDGGRAWTDDFADALSIVRWR